MLNSAHAMVTSAAAWFGGGMGAILVAADVAVPDVTGGDMGLVAIAASVVAMLSRWGEVALRLLHERSGLAQQVVAAERLAADSQNRAEMAEAAATRDREDRLRAEAEAARLRTELRGRLDSLEARFRQDYATQAMSGEATPDPFPWMAEADAIRKEL